jgi:flagellar motor protein MotB
MTMKSLFAHIPLMVLGFVLISFTALSQPSLSTTNKKALAQYEQALRAYDKSDYTNSAQALKNAIKFDNRFIEAHIMLSQVYQVTNQVELAVVAAEEAIRINPDFFPHLYYNVANMLFRKGDYERALNHYTSFLKYNNIRAETRKIAELRKASCEFGIHAVANPVPFNPINLGSNVNSSMDEYWPSLSADENTLVITVNVPKDASSDEIMFNRQEDFFITTRDENGKWKPVRSIGPPINSPMFNEGAQSLTADGETMYYTVCRGNCDLYVSKKESDGNWGRPQRLPEPLNLSHSSEKQPSISPDGKTLYFVSNRGGGLGGFDIWRSHKKNDNEWTKPENLGDSINTPYMEQSPFIHFDNQTLYFSSDGHVGMGGLDIYMAKMVNDSTWTRPVNLGYPINRHFDDDGLIVNAQGTMAYFSSVVKPESGRDIYKFELPEQVRPTPSSYISGTITDSKSGWPLRANFSLVDIESKQTVMANSASSNGSFFLCIPTNKNYAFFASTPGYLFYSENFNLTGIYTADEPFRKDIELRPIQVGETMVMRNVFFETASYELKTESIIELTKLIELLTLNPKMIIEVGGHTDNVGNAEYNLSLSDNRAKSVAQFLVDNGIQNQRITSKGYGLTKPIGDNTTDEGRAINRRTEIRVVGM